MLIEYLSDSFVVYNLGNLDFESKIFWLYQMLLQIYVCIFFALAAKAQLKGEVRISEKTLEGSEKIKAPKR